MRLLVMPRVCVSTVLVCVFRVCPPSSFVSSVFAVGRWIAGVKSDTAVTTVVHRDVLNVDSRTLDLSHCTDVSDGDVTAMMCNVLPEVTFLTLNGCGRVSDDALCGLSTQLKRVRLIALRRCNAITDAGLHAIASNCALLETLDVAECTGVRACSGCCCVRTTCPREGTQFDSLFSPWVASL